MSRCECGRFRVTERQSSRWFDWCQRGRWASRFTQPIWWRLSYRCLGWYDCINAQMVADGQVSDYPRWVLWLFRIERLHRDPA
jgi:hypothetical protein